MEITTQQAGEAMRAVEQAGRQMRSKMIYHGVGQILILWGIIWAICFSIGQFVPKFTNWGWIIGNIIGISGTAWLGWLSQRSGPVVGESEKKLGRRLAWFWFSLFIFADIWLILLFPWHGRQLQIFIVTLIMFAYVVMGLWLEMRLMLWLGIVVTAFSVGGYIGLSYVLPGYLDLWMACMGGGAFLVSGVYLVRKWG